MSSPAPALRGASTRTHDRRSDRRYPVAVELRYRLLDGERLREAGTGRLVNISRGGVLFELPAAPPEGAFSEAGRSIELAIRWPFLADGGPALKLSLRGRVVRTEARRIAVANEHREFQTGAD